MAASLAMQSAYLSASSFPVVVLTECDVLNDLERTQIIDQLGQLIDERERHALVIDLSLGSALPDAQRIYVAETLEMRKTSVIAKWAALAIVVGEPQQSKIAKASAWMQISPVPTQVFGNLEAATRWAEDQVNPGGSAARPVPESPRPSRIKPVMSGMPEGSSRTSGAAAPPSVHGRTSIGEYLKSGEKEGTKPAPKAKPKGMRAWLTRPRAIGAGVAVVASIVLFLAAPPSDGQLSAAEARGFAKARAGIALRLTRPDKDGRTAVPLTHGGTAKPGDSIGFEIDVPAKAYVMVLQARDDGSAVGAGPWSGQASGWLVEAGSKMALPAEASLGSAEGKEAFYLVACAQNFWPVRLQRWRKRADLPFGLRGRGVRRQQAAVIHAGIAA